jgi:hypothetical protein
MRGWRRLMRRSRWQMRRLRGKKERGIHHRVRRGHGGRAGKKKTTQRRRDAETQSTLSYAENFAEEGAIGSNGSRIGGERSDCLVDGKTASLKIARVRHPNAGCGSMVRTWGAACCALTHLW